jgi:hypothetical protein
LTQKRADLGRKNSQRARDQREIRFWNCSTFSMPRPQSEENDIPFAANDNRGRPGTMDKPVDAIDAPARADSELGEDQDLLPQTGTAR